MIIIVSAILFVVGMTLLAIGLALSVLRLAVLVIAWCGCALALVVTGCVWLVMPRREDTEPVGITINVYLDEDEGAPFGAPMIELPRDSFRRLS
jgi:hypothetical protein